MRTAGSAGGRSVREGVSALVAIALVGAFLYGLLSSDFLTASSQQERLIAFDITEHKLTAERRYISYHQDTASSYVERIHLLGDGKTYWIELLQYMGQERAKILNPDDREQFDRLERQMRLGGAAHRILFHRDYRVTDVDLFLQNYQIIPLDPGVVGRPAIGGDPFALFFVRPYQLDRPLFEVAVSVHPLRAGMPLYYREFAMDENTQSVQLVSEMEVLSLDYGTYRQRPRSHSPVQKRSRLTLAEAQRRSPRPLLFPSRLPSGFQLSLCEEVTMRTDVKVSGQLEDVNIYRMIFSDGLDRIELLQHEKTMRGLEGALVSGNNAAQTHNLVVPVRKFGSLSSSILVWDDLQIVVEGRLAFNRFSDVVRNLRQL